MIKKNLYEKMEHSKEFETRVDEIMEGVAQDADVDFEEPKNRKKKYHNYRILTEPNSPKSQAQSSC